jgi:hypothetical protein
MWSSGAHVVRIRESDLCDFLNASGEPITEALVRKALCAIYDEPGRYPWATIARIERP